MDSNTVEEFILGFFIASLFGFIVLYRLLAKRPQRASTEAQRNASVQSSEKYASLEDGESDVVVVGAGVAGSALAYSLAKVS